MHFATEMQNDEGRNSNVERKSNDENANDEMETARAMQSWSGPAIRHSSFGFLSTFEFRHSTFPARPIVGFLGVGLQWRPRAAARIDRGWVACLFLRSANPWPKLLQTAITPTRNDDFPEWYQQVVRAADLAENSDVRGCMVIKPWGYAHVGERCSACWTGCSRRPATRTPTFRCSSR